MGKKRISKSEGLAALADQATQLPTAVRYLLQEIETTHPGHSLEIRVPPYGAIQCLEGLEHRRGTPPNVLEIEPEEFVGLCLGNISFDEAKTLRASGARAKEAECLFPLSGY